MSENIKIVIDAVENVITKRGKNCCLEGVVDLGYVDDKSLIVAEESLHFKCSCGKCCWSSTIEIVLPHPECSALLDALKNISAQERKMLFDNNWKIPEGSSCQ